MALRGTAYFRFAVICHISFYGPYLTPVSCSTTAIYPSSQSSPVVSSTSTSILFVSTLDTSEEFSIVPSTLQTTEESLVSYIESASATTLASDSSDKKSLEASEFGPSSQPTSHNSNYESLETFSSGPSSQPTSDSSNYESLVASSSGPYSQPTSDSSTYETLEATESDPSLEATLASQTGAPSVTFESGSVSAQSTSTATSTPFLSETKLFSTSSQEAAPSTPLDSSLDGPLLTKSVSPTVNTLSTEGLTVIESSMKSVPSTDTDTVETSSFVVTHETSTPVMTKESTTPLQTSESNEALPSMPTTSLYSPSTATSEPLSTVAVTGGPGVTTETTTEDQGTNSTKVVYQFNRTMLLVCVGLICGTGVIVVFLIIGHRCRAHRGGHSLQTLKEETDEILSQMGTIESSTDVTDVDLSRVESVAINVTLPPPPPIILEPTEDLPDPDYDDDGNQVAKRNGDIKDERLRPDYWSYRDNGNIHMRTFKGSERRKNKTQSWAPGRSLDRDEEDSSKVASDENTLVNKETLL